MADFYRIVDARTHKTIVVLSVRDKETAIRKFAADQNAKEKGYTLRRIIPTWEKRKGRKAYILGLCGGGKLRYYADDYLPMVDLRATKG